MCSVRPVPPVQPDRCPATDFQCGEVVPLAARRTVMVVHEPRRRPVAAVAPISRHRREEAPGCMRALRAAATALAGWVLAWVRRKAAQLCHRLVAARTACGTAAA